jgi:hypothetical protein
MLLAVRGRGLMHDVCVIVSSSSANISEMINTAIGDQHTV